MEGLWWAAGNSGRSNIRRPQRAIGRGEGGGVDIVRWEVLRYEAGGMGLWGLTLGLAGLRYLL